MLNVNKNRLGANILIRIDSITKFFEKVNKILVFLISFHYTDVPDHNTI
jgi:hypothetical protein